MARNQEPMNDDDLERAKEEISDAFNEVRADAEGGDEEAVDDEGGEKNQ
jgi:hypothetical protein